MGRNRSTITFGMEIPTKEDWTRWQAELSKIHTPTLVLLSPLDKWRQPSARVWRYYFDENEDKIRAKSEEGTEVHTRMNGRCRRCSLSHTEEETAITGHPATIVELEGGALRLQEVGGDQVVEVDKEHGTSIEHLKN